jgi:hypothetical protein
LIAIKQAKESAKEVNDEEKKVEEEKKWMEKYQFSDARIYSVHDWLYAYWFVAVRRFWTTSLSKWLRDIYWARMGR